MAQRAEDEWNARVWRVRAKDGRQAPEPVSLTKIRRGVELGKLHVDMEIAQVSLAACHEVGAYASAVHMAMLFSGRELEETCAKVACTLSLKGAPQQAE